MDVKSTQHFLSAEFNELVSYIEKREQKKEAVSKADVAWHIGHCFLVIRQINKVLVRSDPSAFNSRFNWKRTYVLWTNSMPRGIGRSPKAVLPPEEMTLEDIKRFQSEAAAYLNTFEQLPSKAFFKHPIFGNLHKEHTRKFLRVHTLHHLKIIRDILKG